MAIRALTDVKQPPAPHPVFDSLGGVSGLFLGVVLRQHVDQAQEVDLPPGGTCSQSQRGLSGC